MDFSWHSKLALNIVCLIVSAVIVLASGTKLAQLADQIADQSGLGEAFIGTIFLGLVTSLPGIAASASAASNDSAALMANNALGGIAIQTVFLAGADLFYKKANLEHAAASLSNIIQTIILVLLLTIIVIAFLTPDIAAIPLFSPWSVALILVAGVGIHLTRQVNTRPMWTPRFTKETVEDRPQKRKQQKSLSELIVAGIAFGAILIISGWLAAESANNIVSHSDVSESFMGVVFLAIATSLPELATSVAAVRAGALTLAISDIVGGNFFDALFFAVGDAFYTKGSIFHAEQMSLKEPFFACICILLNVVLLGALITRQERGPARIGIEGFLLVFIYLGGLIIHQTM